MSTGFNKEFTKEEIFELAKDFEKEAQEYRPQRLNPKSDIIVYDSKQVQAMWRGYLAGRMANRKGFRNLSAIEKELCEKQDIYNNQDLSGLTELGVLRRDELYNEITVLMKLYSEHLKRVKDKFCNDYALAFKCEPKDVLRELDRKDPVFLSMFSVFQLGINVNLE